MDECCSLVGAFAVVLGLYCVLWGKRTDNLVADEQPGSENCADNNNIVEISMEDGLVQNPISKKEYGRKTTDPRFNSHRLMWSCLLILLSKNIINKFSTLHEPP